MQVLAYEHAAAIVKLQPRERLKWHALGQYVYRGRRKGIWKPALTEQDVARAIDDRASYVRRIVTPLSKIRRPTSRTK